MSFDVTVEDACGAYVEHRKINNGAASADDADGRFRRQVYGKPIGKIPLAKLQTKHVKEWLYALVEQSQPEDEEDTLRTPDQVALEVSADRKQLLSGRHVDVAALALDAAESIGADNSLEKMLAHEMALAHDMAFKLTDRAMGTDDPHVSAKLAGMSARLMETFQRGVMILQRLRSGNTQVVTVQHVQINGGQAVVAGAMATQGAPTK